MAELQVNRLKVRIHGTEYTLRGSAPTSHLKMVADIVNRMMDDVSAANSIMDEKHIAVLTALNLADELLKLQGEHKELLNLLDEQTRAD